MLKIFKLSLILFLFFYVSITYARDIDLSLLQFQSVNTKEISWWTLKLSWNNSVVIIPVNDAYVMNWLLKINFKRQNFSQNNIVVWFWRSDVKFNQDPNKFFQLWNNQDFTEFNINMESIPEYSWMISHVAIVFLGNDNIEIKNISLDYLSIFTKLNLWLKEALEYKPYNPRTVNFLEWPMWFWDYINKPIVNLLLWILSISFFIYFFSVDQGFKKKIIYINVWAIVFFWLFLDFLSTVNEVRIFNDNMSAKNIMENWRVWKNSDLYDFLNFIRTKVPNREKWFFLASYPFDLEWRYHIYPDVKFDEIKKVKYIFWYNPYWSGAPFDFKDPKYENWVLTVGDNKINIKDVITWKEYAKIYIVK